MKFSALTFITLAASSVYGSVIDPAAHEDTFVNLETRATCWKSDMQAVKDRINHYNVFCQMYNAQYLTGACSCLLAQWNKQANPTSVPSTAANTCAASDINLIKNEAPKNFQSYCTWWGLIASQITKSCKCLLASTGNTASTAVKATSTKTTSTAKATSTAAACKKRRKVRRTVTVEVPAEATPSV
ncbi:unnamed protein product [Aureobasidium pullulans]|nr:unnamed protein product [Aureobasidium pullulans]